MSKFIVCQCIFDLAAVMVIIVLTVLVKILASVMQDINSSLSEYITRQQKG